MGRRGESVSRRGDAAPTAVRSRTAVGQLPLGSGGTGGRGPTAIQAVLSLLVTVVLQLGMMLVLLLRVPILRGVIHWGLSASASQL